MRKPCAYSLIRSQPVYRRQAFDEGLRAAGYDVREGTPGNASSGDLLICWNRYGAVEAAADRWEAQGGTVIVAENGYLDPGRHTDRRWYAMALGGHNGSGLWRSGGPERWSAIASQLGARVLPWREKGDHVLVCPSRSFGRRGLIMPSGWVEGVVERLRRLTQRPVRVRPHPGNDAPQKPLAEDLKNCWAVAVWHSSAGVQALLSGIPVICEAPFWICKEAAGSLEQIEAPPMPDRLPVMQRLAFAQWELREIESGEAFRSLLPDSGETKGAAAL